MAIRKLSKRGFLEFLIPKKILSLIFTLVLIFNLILIFRGAMIIGLTADDPTHVERLENYFKNGDYGTLEGNSDSRFYVYAPIFALFAHILNIFAGNETYGILSNSLAAYEIRHLAVAIVSFIGTAAVYGISLNIFKSKFWGIVSATVLTSIPLWTGYSMMNIKDIPVATGITLIIFGLIITLKQTNSDHSKLHTLISKVWCVFITSTGMLLAIGTRIGIWPLVAILFLNAFAYTAFEVIKTKRNSHNYLKIHLQNIFVLICSITLFILIFKNIYPIIFESGLSAFKLSIYASSNFEAYYGGTLINGVNYDKNPPWWYIPFFFVNQVPVAILFISIIGITISFTQLFSLKKNLENKFFISLLLVQALVVVFAIIYFKSTIYSGLRQVLFIFPAWAILATFGLKILLEQMAKMSNASVSRYIVNTTWLIFLLFTFNLAYVQLQIFPYNQIYYNELPLHNNLNDRWLLHSWGTYKREAISKIPKETNFTCKANFKFPRYDPAPCSIDSTNYSGIQPSYKEVLYSDNDFFLIVPPSKLNDTNAFEKYCNLSDTVSRKINNENVNLGIIFLCSTDNYYLKYQLGSAVTFVGDTLNSMNSLVRISSDRKGIWTTDYYGEFGIRVDNLINIDPKTKLEIEFIGTRLVPPSETRNLKLSLNGVEIGEYIFKESNQSIPIKSEIELSKLKDAINDGVLIFNFDTPDPIQPSRYGLFDSWDLHSLYLESFKMSIK